MLVLIDIGNTNITAGFHHDDEIRNIVRIESHTEGHTIDELMRHINDYARQHEPEGSAGAAICSVVPGTAALIKDAIKKKYGFNPLNVTCRVNTGLSFRIKNIEGLGADRIANAAAARNLYKGDLVVLDFGTATTFCVITADGEYRGGAIMPGLAMAADSLADHTAKLPRVSLKKPEKILCSDTIDNIQAGLIYGHAGAVERIINEIRKEVNSDLTVVATGGLSSLITPYIKVIDHVNPLLTLEGLKFIYTLNSIKIH